MRPFLSTRVREEKSPRSGSSGLGLSLASVPKDFGEIMVSLDFSADFP
jgi:hypothetical protein